MQVSVSVLVSIKCYFYIFDRKIILLIIVVQGKKIEICKDRGRKLLATGMKKKIFQHTRMGEMKMVLERCHRRRKVLIPPVSQEAWCVMSVEKCTRQFIF